MANSMAKDRLISSDDKEMERIELKFEFNTNYSAYS